MKKVNYAVLEDIKKYIAGFNPKEYEISYSKTDSTVIEYARDYYDKHLPVDVTAWTRVIQETNIFYKIYYYQCFA